MFENVGYPCALAAGPRWGDRGVRDAIIWTRRHLGRLTGQILVFVPSEISLRVHDRLAALVLAPHVAVGTWRTMPTWSGGPVLAAWPDTRHLMSVAEDSRTTALCVVPDLAHDLRGWVADVRPERLGPAALAGSSDARDTNALPPGDDARIHHVLYSSRATVPLRPDELQVLLSNSRTRNAEAGISGILVHVNNDEPDRPGFFLQWLEGPAPAVTGTFRRILRDELHRHLVILRRGSSAERLFAGWQMDFDIRSEQNLRELAGDDPALAGMPVADLLGHPSAMARVIARFDG